MTNPFERSDDFKYFYDTNEAINSDAQKLILHTYSKDLSSYNNIQQLADRECVGAFLYSYYDDWQKEFNEVLKKLAQLPNLKHLDISTKYLIDESILSQFQSLEHLTIRTEVPQPISLSLPNLRVLDLENIPDLSPELYQVPSLEALRITRSKLSDHDFSVLPKLQNLQHLHLNTTKLRQLPEEIIQLPQLQSISFRFNPIKDWDETFKILAQLPNMHSLDLNNYNLKTLSNNIGLLTQIKKLDLTSNKLSNLPVGLQQLTQLEELQYQRTDIPIDNQIETLAHMPLIQSFYLFEMSEKVSLLPHLTHLSLDIRGVVESYEAISTLSNLQNLTVHCNAWSLPETLVETIKDLAIHTLTVYGSSDLPKNLSVLTHLQELNLMSAAESSTISKVASIPNLQKLQISLPYDLPEDMHLLKGLKDIHVNFFSTQDHSLELPSSMIEFDQTTFVSQPPKVFDKLNHYIKSFANAGLDEAQKKLAFTIITDQRKLLDEVIPNPFGEDFDPSQCVFFLAGRTEGLTQKEIKEKLKEQGIKVATKLHKKVTHVLVGRLVKNTLIDTIMQRPELQLTLEDHLKGLFISFEQPFLLDDDAEALNENVLEMLFNEDTTNIQVALTMLEDGGANAKIITAVMLLSLYHKDKNLRKDARKIYKKYASASLQNHVKANKPSSFKPLYYFQAIYKHPEIDREIFLVMHMMLGDDYYRHFHIPRDWEMKCLPPEAKYLKSLYSITIKEASPDFDFMTSLDLLQNNKNIRRITINNCKGLKSLPPKFFEYFPNLSDLDLEGNDLKDVPIEILKLTKLSSIDLCGNPIEALPEFLAQLEELRRVKISAKHLKTQIPKALEDYVYVIK